MKSYPFTSVLSHSLQGFLDEKRALGFKYETEEYVLHCFDRYWAEVNGQSEEITMESLAGWVKQKPTEGKSSQSQRICVVRQFSLYRNGIGIASYIPTEKIHRPRPIVHILSLSEIKELFRVIDQYHPTRPTAETARMANEYKVIFRLILATGIRRSEAVSIRLRDIDLRKNLITIYNSKGRKDRRVYLSSDMAELLTAYLSYLRQAVSAEMPWLFPSVRPDRHISSGGLAIRFRLFWSATAYADTCGKAPTIHALRHTFVVLRMNEWMRQGKDLNIMLPYLSKHLGHKSPAGTFYYYHQVAEAFSIIHEKDTWACAVLPEVRVR